MELATVWYNDSIHCVKCTKKKHFSIFTIKDDSVSELIYRCAKNNFLPDSILLLTFSLCETKNCYLFHYRFIISAVSEEIEFKQ